MEVVIKEFNDLNLEELWEIYAVRGRVFIVEQGIVYEDPDNYDKISTHIYYRENGIMIAYLRVIPIDEKNCKIGRVISLKRGCGIGSDIMRVAIKYCEDKGYEKIKISSQSYIKSMYEKLGFVQISEEYTILNVLHVDMELEINKKEHIPIN
ncbi:GNAT family N-acetyltransferase [Streptobacillus canis]|uniref:GNAT family N-acetyltransferase n=1 Tax=Streptobacillus canis TaxID=2678686 RepID=UPI0012E14460|nr:GNAT family N-acetyltransferase [Streptobacillus canis]